MTIAAQGSIVSFAVQSAKIGSGVFSQGGQTWYKMRTPAHDLGTVQDQQVFPLETGGPLTPSGTYKQGVFYGGTIDMIPRIEDSFGWILKSTMGQVSSVTGKDADGTTVAGVNTHIFRFDPTNEASQPWMAWRRLIPGVNTAANFGETGYDCKVAAMRFTVPNQGKVAARAAVIGRAAVFETNPSWSYSNANFEDTTTTPNVGFGQFKLGGTTYPIIGASIDVTNGLSQVQQEMVVGSYNPDDFIALTRNATIRIVYKYENADLYKKILGGSTGATEWTPNPFVDVSGGGVFAFDARFKAGVNIPTTSTPYELRIRGNRVSWSVDSAIQIQAGNMITQTFTGLLESPTDASSYLEVVLMNGKTTYA